MTGTVIWFNAVSGFGFIETTQTKKKVFVHYSQIDSSETFKTLKTKDFVKFELYETVKGLEAKKVKKIV